MGRIKTQSNEDRLLKKRLAEKIRQEKIKKDPDRFLQEKIKNQLKYENKKKKGIVKPVNKMSLSEKRAQRKKWQENSRRYRQNKKMIAKELKPKTLSSNNEKKNYTNLPIVCTFVPSNTAANFNEIKLNESIRDSSKSQEQKLKITKTQQSDSLET